MRDEFSQSVVVALRERVSGLCSNPDCRCPTTGPNSDAAKATRIGVAAHITAASPGGPRYDRALSSQDRSSAKNGIWLCRVCERKIDVDSQRYPVHLLLHWKDSAEDESRRNLGVPKKDNAQPSGNAGMHCPHCNTTFSSRQTVCTGCRGQIVWGATYQERKTAAISGMAAAGLPLIWICSYFDINIIKLGGGLRDFIPFISILATAFFSGLFCMRQMEVYRRNRPPRIFVRRIV